MLQDIWDGKAKRYSPEYTLQTAAALTDALVKGWKESALKELAGKNAFTIPDIGIEYDSPDWGAITMMEANVFKFSAAKSWDVVNQLNGLLPSSPTFNDFKKQAAPILGQYNVNYLRTEYETAYSTAQNSARYWEMIRSKNIYPGWRYMTVGDGRVRPAHKELHGRVFKADGDAWDLIYPPNGWGCRCYVDPVMEEPPGGYSTKEDAENLLAAEPGDKDMNQLELMRKTGFGTNKAKLAQVFDDGHMYAKTDFNATLGIKDNGVKPFSQLTPPKSNLQPFTPADAKKWKEDAKGTLKDYAGRPVKIVEKVFDKHIDPNYKPSEQRFKWVQKLDEALLTPDEVYLQQKAKGTANSPGAYDIVYYKFFEDEPFKVIMNVTKELDFTLETWYVQDIPEVDRKRNGILMYKTPGR